MQTSQVQWLHRAYERLKESEKVGLYVQLGMPMPRIADALGLSVNQVVRLRDSYYRDRDLVDRMDLAASRQRDSLSDWPLER